MAELQPDPARFNALTAALSSRILAELNQDPGVALDVDPNQLRIRGLIEMEGGQPTWLRWDIDWQRLFERGPEDMASDMVQSLRLARNQHKLLRALANPKYDWRTLEGLAKETGLAADEVTRLLPTLEDEVIQSRIPDQKGRALFSTRQHYRATHNAVVRLGDIFRTS